VRRKAEWFVLAMALLWAALPSLACLAPAPQHACCRQMMHDCGSSNAMAHQSCCKMQAPDTNLPPAQTSRTEATILAGHATLFAIGAAAPLQGVALAQTAEMPPGQVAADRNSILRI